MLRSLARLSASLVLLCHFALAASLSRPRGLESKTSLLRYVRDLNYGVTATAADNQRIEELVQSLIDSDAPRTTAPAEAFFRSSAGGRSIAEGNWTLLYTNGPDVTGIGKIPGVKLTYVGQKVDTKARLITNYVNASGVLADTAQEVYVGIRQRNASAVDLDFESTKIKLLKLFGSPKFLGKNVEEWKPFEFKINQEEFKKSLERSKRSPPFFNVLYLDDTLRIQRTGEGYLFIIAKQAPPSGSTWSLGDNLGDGAKRILGILGIVPYVIFAAVALKDFLNYDITVDVQ